MIYVTGEGNTGGGNTRGIQGSNAGSARDNRDWLCRAYDRQGYSSYDDCDRCGPFVDDDFRLRHRWHRSVEVIQQPVIVERKVIVERPVIERRVIVERPVVVERPPIVIRRPVRHFAVAPSYDCDC